MGLSEAGPSLYYRGSSGKPVMILADLIDPNPKTFVVAALMATVGTWLPWTAMTAIFADTSWPDVGRDFVALLYMAVSSYFIYLARRDAGKAKAAADETGEKVDGVKEVVGSKPQPDSPTLIQQAGAAASKADAAARLAKTAAQVAVESERRATVGREVLGKIAEHTNGEFAKLKAERDALQKWKEDTLAAQTPPADAVLHVAETVDAIADATGAPKSGTKLKALPRDPASRERRDDPPPKG